ncbi:MAG: PDZ domain-containing protein [Candidatus Longimicrobiales bacterium M2_2A_002]
MRHSRFIGRRTAPVLLAGAALLAASGATAQEPEVDTQRENCICFDGDEVPLAGTSFLRGDRARLGVMLGDEVEVDGGVGVEIQDVMDDAPAATAGLMAGDIITALDGEPLGDDATEALMGIMEDIEPGDAVEVTYVRDGDRRVANVVTDRMDRVSYLFPGGERSFDVRIAPRMRMGSRGRPGDRLHDGPDLRVMTPGRFFRSAAPGGLDLVAMNPGLGDYFGTDDGVLVADIDDDSELGLRAGDVILAIDGRKVRDAAHVRAILDSYRPDEEIMLEIVREARTMEVTGTLR